jgi:hypothetical protein
VTKAMGQYSFRKAATVQAAKMVQFGIEAALAQLFIFFLKVKIGLLLVRELPPRT